jgi:hypothetical protein
MSSPSNSLINSQRSAIDQDIISIDKDTQSMLESIGFKDLPGTQLAGAARG